MSVIANIKFSSNNLRSQLIAVKSGVGLGLLHTFIADNHQDLQKVLKKDINIKREYWMVVHENIYQLQRVKVVCTFITEKIRESLKNLNLVGLKRKGLNSKIINEIKKLINIIFDKNDAIENNIKINEVATSEIHEIKEIVEFINSNSKRGITNFEND